MKQRTPLLTTAVLAALALTGTGLAGSKTASTAQAQPDVAVESSSADMFVSVWDGCCPGESPASKQKLTTDFEEFDESESVSDERVDATDNRGGRAGAQQYTLIVSPSDLARVESSAEVAASYFWDAGKDEDQIPDARGNVGLVVNIVVNRARPYRLLGHLVVQGDSFIGPSCSDITVKSPGGTEYRAARGLCEGSAPVSLDINERGTLEPGSYRFEVVANAEVKANGPSGSMRAFWGLELKFCDNRFTSGDDTITGTGGEDILCGGGGNDTIHGGGGNDVIYGGAGTDRINGGPGNEVRDGGAEPGIDGGPGTDFLRGGPDDDFIVGGDGNERDELYGEGGLDKLRGNGGPDLLHGGAGRDVLNGGAGNDRLRAKDGTRDTVAGGPNTDNARVDPADQVSGVENVTQ